LLMRRQSPSYAPPFELVDYKVLVGRRHQEEAVSDAAIKIRVRGEVVHAAAEGNGPVSALDAALRKALSGAYPEVAGIRLEDYKVRIIDGDAGTSAKVRVLIDNGFGEERWTTVGASPNVLEASWIALADGIEYGLSVARAAAGAQTAGDKQATGDRAMGDKQAAGDKADPPARSRDAGVRAQKGAA
jgi:2-isopropylmalate synthase